MKIDNLSYIELITQSRRLELRTGNIVTKVSGVFLHFSNSMSLQIEVVCYKEHSSFRLHSRLLYTYIYENTTGQRNYPTITER